MNDAEMKQIAAQICKMIYEAEKNSLKGYDTTAEVRRIEDGKAIVHIPGGVDETPVKMGVNARPGDTVEIHVEGGTASVGGNITSPPTDDKAANKAQATATKADKTAAKAESVAAEAQETADKIKQHFWTDDDGAHITQVAQEEFEEDPSTAGGNLLITSSAVSVRDGEKALAVMDGSGLKAYDDRYEDTPVMEATAAGIKYTNPVTGYAALLDQGALEFYEHGIAAAYIDHTDGYLSLKARNGIKFKSPVGGTLQTLDDLAIYTSVTTGEIAAKVVRKWGQMLQLTLTVRNSAAVASGANICLAQLLTEDPITGTPGHDVRPAINVTGGSYIGTHAVSGAILPDGTVTIRNASPSSIPANSGVTISFTYLIE